VYNTHAKMSSKDELMSINKHFYRGFTIVELIIVIVIIGILAAISFVSYGGVRNKAINISLQSDLANASDQLVIDQARSSSGVFPSTLSEANSGDGIPASGGTAYQYIVDNADTPKTFCLTATKSSQSYFITQEGKPLPGPCPVLYLDVGITTSYPGTGTNWNDLSGRGNNSVLSNTSYSSSNGGSLVFNGSSGYTSVADPVNGSLDFGTGDFTVSMWVRPSIQNTYMSIFHNGSTNFTNDLWININSGVLLVRFDNTKVISSGVINTGAWSNIVVERAGSVVTAYINGTASPLGSSSANISDSNGNLLLGKDAGNYRYYNGNIGEVRVYSVALSADDVNKSFDTMRGRYGI